MKKISVKDKLPEHGQYVLVIITRDTWMDYDDPEGNRYFRVVKFVKGLSEEDREKLPFGHMFKTTYRYGDEFDNNLVPYAWEEFGPAQYYGQEVDFWFELPKN